MEVLVPAGGRVRGTDWLTVQETTRPPATWSWHGTPCAEPVRAVADAARRSTDQRSARAVVLGAVQEGVCTAEALRIEVEAGAQRGSGLLRRAVDDAEHGAWSAPEAEAADLVADAVRGRRLPHALLSPVPAGRWAGALGHPTAGCCMRALGRQVDSRAHHLDPRRHPPDARAPRSTTRTRRTGSSSCTSHCDGCGPTERPGWRRSSPQCGRVRAPAAGARGAAGWATGRRTAAPALAVEGSEGPAPSRVIIRTGWSPLGLSWARQGDQISGRSPGGAAQGDQISGRSPEAAEA